MLHELTMFISVQLTLSFAFKHGLMFTIPQDCKDGQPCIDINRLCSTLYDTNPFQIAYNLQCTCYRISGILFVHYVPCVTLDHWVLLPCIFNVFPNYCISSLQLKD